MVHRRISMVSSSRFWQLAMVSGDRLRCKHEEKEFVPLFTEDGLPKDWVCGNGMTCENLTPPGKLQRRLARRRAARQLAPEREGIR